MITPTHNRSQATQQKQMVTQILPVDSTASATQDFISQHQPQATPTEPAARATHDLDSKHQRDLNTLLHRKSHIQSRIATRNKQAAYEDYKARRMLAWPPNFKQDVQACLSEAARLRVLADQDQKEVDAIDEHLTGAMGGEQKERVVPGRIGQLTRFRVQDLAPEEQMDLEVGI
ncbi:hypothetical protein BDU57DRAFT_518874 [Ampelomyces quisqualis]|uniref:Uncharacterized protein n=1 Tax=Ampelomyces quisqualis TaxID=50730 RepID=A0A6A5QJF7_AMPQU|nr:hypothetical protein BDU57DRAFT_518874 [Ampelomyces quisqualis]